MTARPAAADPADVPHDRPPAAPAPPPGPGAPDAPPAPGPPAGLGEPPTPPAEAAEPSEPHDVGEPSGLRGFRDGGELGGVGVFGDAREGVGAGGSSELREPGGAHRAGVTRDSNGLARSGGFGEGDGAIGGGGAGASAAGPGGPGRGRRGRKGGRARRWARRLGLGVVVLIVAVTVFSFSYNAATAGRMRAPAGLQFVQAGDVRTRYLHWGTQGSPIVLVHGAAESADTWEGVAAGLAARHRVFALDLTGWGYSERRGPYDVEHQAAQLLGFLDAVGLPQAALVGHSSGAGVIAEAALRAPARVAGLAFLDGDALDTGAGEGADAVRFLLRDPYRTTLMRLAIRSDWVIRKIYSGQCGPACARLDRAGVDRWRRPLQVAGAERALWRMKGVIGLPAWRVAALAGLRVPKAVVFGAGDDVFSRATPAETARRIGAPPPVIVPGARHLALVSHPRQVAAALDAAGLAPSP